MVGDEIVVEGADVSDHEVAVCICRQLGLPEPEPSKKGTMHLRTDPAECPATVIAA
jgi:hypothetical protein